MEKQIATIQKCVLLRQDIEIWVSEEKAKQIRDLLLGNFNGRFIKIEDRIINVADITGVFSAQDLEEVRRRKQGQWKCEYGNWHEKKEECSCYFNNRHTEISDKQKTTELESEITPEQAKKNREAIDRVRKDLIDKKIMTDKNI